MVAKLGQELGGDLWGACRMVAVVSGLMASRAGARQRGCSDEPLLGPASDARDRCHGPRARGVRGRQLCAALGVTFHDRYVGCANLGISRAVDITRAPDIRSAEAAIRALS